MHRKQVASATDHRSEIRTQLEALELSALENFVAAQTQQANTEAFMAHGFSMSERAMERHMERVQIAQDVLAERYVQIAQMVETADAERAAEEHARWMRMNEIDEAGDYQIAQYEEGEEDDGGLDGEEF